MSNHFVTITQHYLLKSVQEISIQMGIACIKSKNAAEIEENCTLEFDIVRKHEKFNTLDSKPTRQYDEKANRTNKRILTNSFGFKSFGCKLAQ